MGKLLVYIPAVLMVVLFLLAWLSSGKKEPKVLEEIPERIEPKVGFVNENIPWGRKGGAWKG